MCFSAAGSFALSGVLAGTGAVAMAKNPSRPHRLFAAIPLMFATQQAAEGVVWLTIGDPARAMLQHLSVAVFLGIAVVIWPIWCPLSLTLAERDPARKRVLSVLSWIGAGVSLCAVILLLRWQPVAIVAGHSIQYPHQESTLGRYTVLVYAAVALLPFFVSTTRLARTIGTTFVLSLLVTIVAYREALTSVWCFFAAILSALILAAIIQERRAARS
jgi:hypothetical protein